MSTDDSLVRTVLILIAVILLLPLFVMILAMPVMGLWGWGHMWDSGMWNGTGAAWMWLLMSIIPIAIVLVVGYLLYRLIRHLATRQSDPALEELRTAYAQGEISDEEFEERRNRLERKE
ncbi:SHOCT domain-containing protein [Natronococcus occultus]|uniref:SHOCT domain-containing protein n=1 Tax=Natronococcus occultus TaxID=29288 RepID=UPI0006778309|nr:SHOCT domain-containing protein [Natronococcus occultus]